MLDPQLHLFWLIELFNNQPLWQTVHDLNW